MIAATSQPLGAAAVKVLATGSARDKAEASRKTAAGWRLGRFDPASAEAPPDRPCRPEAPQLLPPGKMPKRRKAGGDDTRIALLHALAHIELNAIDLAWDMVARFGAAMPRGFVDDWVRVADEEAKHFLLLDDRLATLGSHYGALPAHDGLWQAAERTAHDLNARLAIVPMVLEARGLDVTPGMIERFSGQGDHATADILRIIYQDEIGHVAVGTRWFEHQCAILGQRPADEFQRLVSQYFDGNLKAPFNKEARDAARLFEEFYLPLL